MMNFDCDGELVTQESVFRENQFFTCQEIKEIEHFSFRKNEFLCLLEQTFLFRHSIEKIIMEKRLECVNVQKLNKNIKKLKYFVFLYS